MKLVIGSVLVVIGVLVDSLGRWISFAGLSYAGTLIEALGNQIGDPL